MTASLFFSSTHSPPPLPSLKPSRRPPIALSPVHTLPQPLPLSSSHTPASSNTSPRWPQKLLLQSVAAALSFSVLDFPPPFLAAEPPGVSSPPAAAAAAAADICREEEEAEAEALPQSVTNEGLVDEAWEVVDQGFFAGAASRPWSPEIWQETKEYLHNSNIQTRSKAHEIIQKMLASLGDPYTRFLSPSEFSRMARYDVTGIGINLREFPDDHGGIKLKVLGIILDGPAHSAGVRQGDELLSVNGVNVKGKSAFDVSSLLQGPKETFVTIEVKHGNCGPIQSIRVQRQPAARTPVFYRLEKNDKEGVSVGYVHIKEFNALARKDLITALKRLQDSGATYMILDLRDNLGGLVQVGVEVAKLFMNEGETVTYTAGRDPQVQKSIIADGAAMFTSPLIVLVNNRTASASEIVASALHDNCRAVLVGERTYGKGLIQSVFELLDGSGVVVTIGKYVTPNHKDINGNGIVPDFSSLPVLSEVADYISRCQIRKAG